MSVHVADLIRGLVYLAAGAWLAARHRKLVAATEAAGDAATAVFGVRESDARKRIGRVMTRIVLAVLALGFLGGGLLEIGRAIARLF